MRWLRTMVGAFWLLLAGIASAPAAEELSVQQVLDLLDTATKALRSYDVYLQVTETYLVRSERVKITTKDGKEVEVTRPRDLLPGEGPLVEKFAYRQVLAQGKRRIERIDPATGKASSTTVADGEVERSLNPEAISGYLGPMPRQFVSEGSDYSTFYRNEFGDRDLVEILRSRKGTRVIPDPAPGKQPRLVLYSPPESGTTFSIWGFRVFMDPQKALMPVLVEKFEIIEGKEVLLRRTVVDAFHEVEKGLWVPIKVTSTFYSSSQGPLFGKPVVQIVAQVDVARSRWNVPIPDDTFVLKFPPGIHVTDRLRNIKFISGDGDTGENLRALAKRAREVIPINAPPVEEQDASYQHATRLLLVAGAVVLCLAIVVVVCLKRRTSLA